MALSHRRKKRGELFNVIWYHSGIEKGPEDRRCSRLESPSHGKDHYEFPLKAFYEVL